MSILIIPSFNPLKSEKKMCIPYRSKEIKTNSNEIGLWLEKAFNYGMKYMRPGEEGDQELKNFKKWKKTIQEE